MVTLLDVVPPKDYNSFVDLYLVRACARLADVSETMTFQGKDLT